LFEAVYLKFNPQYPFLVVGYIDVGIAILIVILTIFGLFGNYKFSSTIDRNLSTSEDRVDIIK
jgi:hypothetical protein